MNTKELAIAVKNLKKSINDILPEVDGTGIDCESLRDAKDLLGVLAGIVDGKPVEKAFGSPGDWGHDTPIGKALTGRG